MGGSLRRLKKGKTKVKVGVKKTKKTVKAKTPQEITSFRTAIEEKLGFKPEWDEKRTLAKNYASVGFLRDANQGFGRNAEPEAGLVDPEAREAEGEETFENDDELRAGCNLPRQTTKKVPQRLTKRQKQIIKALQQAHGDDIERMVRDRKLNRMLLTADQLRRMCESLAYWGSENSVDFRVPMKNLMHKIR